MSDAVFFNIIDAQLLAAGALGGLVHAFRAEKTTPGEVTRFLVVGGIAANFLTPGFIGIGSNFLSPRILEMMSVLPPSSLAFWIGLAGKPICFALEMVLTGKIGKTKNE